MTTRSGKVEKLVHLTDSEIAAAGLSLAEGVSTPVQISGLGEDVLPANVSQAEAEAGAVTDNRSWSPQRVKQAVQALQLLTAVASQAEAEAGALNTKAMTPLRVAQAIAALASGTVDMRTFQGRLTLESGVAISTSDQSAKTTLYLTPYQGSLIALYDGAAWNYHSLTEISLSLAGLTASKNYDVFVYDNDGTLTLEAVIWTSDTARATALATQDGIYVQTGAATKRYVGTIRINATGGQCEDTATARFVWNCHNRVERYLTVTAPNANWTYATGGGWRYLNNDSTRKVEFVLGLFEDPISMAAYLALEANNSTGMMGIGINSTTPTTGTYAEYYASSTGSPITTYGISYAGRNGRLGYSYLAYVENCGFGTVKHRGAEGGFLSALSGVIRA